MFVLSKKYFFYACGQVINEHFNSGFEFDLLQHDKFSTAYDNTYYVLMNFKMLKILSAPHTLKLNKM